MSETLAAVRALVAAGDVRVSEHSYDALAAERIAVRDILNGLNDVTVVEDYPTFGKGPAVLVLEFDAERRPIHVVWGIPRGHTRPAVLVTAYRPDPQRWRTGFLRRRK